MQVGKMGRSGRARLATVLLSSLGALTLACGGDERGSTGPRLPGNPPPNPQVRSAAFIADVNLVTGKVVISEPPTNVMPGSAMASSPSLSVGALGPGGPNYSIVAGDVVQLTSSNLAASTLGEFVPGKVRVTFDINITNRLSTVRLITPTFPTPPAGVPGVFLFPYEVVPTVTSGGVSVGGDGTDVIVEAPSVGSAVSAVTWDGAPHNFFNDAGCAAGANDCYRYEAYTQPLEAGGTSEARTVGFDIDPTLHSFRARLIVAADLQNSGAAPTGTVAGSVTSPQRGALVGVTVNVNPGSFSGVTGAGGAYSIAGVGVGSRVVSLSNLPSGCSAPPVQNVTVSGGGTVNANFSVTCTVPSGTISGTISSSLGGGLNNVSVTATPTGGSAVGPAISNSTGAYSLSGVPVGASGAGSLALSNLPSNCTNPGAIAYSGLTDGGTINVNITVSCTAPPAGYQMTATWGPITGGQVTLTLRIDMGSFDDPAIPGPDDIDGIQHILLYTNTPRLQYVSAANVAGSGLQNIVANGSTPGQISWINGSTNPGVATQQGLQGLAVFTFNVLAGAPTTVTTNSTFVVSRGDAAASRNGTDLVPRIIVSEGTLSIP